ncbi:Zinc finger protein 354A, partial [Stegodyphus mimosarum]
MMNVLTDILCDSSSLMASHNYKETLSHNKIIASQDISTKQTPLHLLDTVSHISNLERPLSAINHSSPSSIDLFNSSGQIQIPANMEPNFEERNDVSVFSDAFPEIVPSWLTHDFMKVSDNLSAPGILSNVSDIYQTGRENQHLEMLDLGFPTDLASQDVVPNSLNRACINDGQKLLADLPIQRFSSSDSLLIPSFNDINSTQLHISMNKNEMQYQKFKNNNAHHIDSSRSLMNTVLPCENELLHLPLPSNLTDQCLNTSSPSIMSSSQSQSHSLGVCDKLPQINLNHLDSLLGNEPSLSDIQLLRHDFPSVRLDEENGCNQHSNRTCLDNCNARRNIISCNTGNFLSSSTVPTVPTTQDISVQVPEIVFNENFASESDACFSCNQIPTESDIEMVRCFKCKFCDFISLHKCSVVNHINISHSKEQNLPNTRNDGGIVSSKNSDNFNTSVPVGTQSEIHNSESVSLIISTTSVPPVLNADVTVMSSVSNVVNSNDHFQCIKCNVAFSNLSDYKSHLVTHHDCNPEYVSLTPKVTSLGYQLIPINGIIVNSREDQRPQSSVNIPVNCNQNIIQSVSKNLKPQTMKRKIYPKSSDTSPVKISPKKSNVESSISSKKQVSSHKKAWQKKMNRELGSYICEFKGCNMRFRALDNLEYHKKCHVSGGNTFACPECGMEYEKWGAVAGHLWRIHNNDMELHACDQCPFRTYSLGRLENLHKRIHLDECLFLCDICSKKFKNGKQLRNHRVVHSETGEKPKKDNFRCKLCPSYFPYPRLLRLHEAAEHNKRKWVLCNYCNYSTTKTSTLRMHMRQHTGEKPFKCDQCEYRTGDHNSLRRHKMKHSGEKPYKCPCCPYSTIQASCYKAHLKKHPDETEGLMFSCNICSFQTLKQNSYIAHMTEHNMLQRENYATDMNVTDEIFPLAEAMDISLSHGDDNHTLHNKDKSTQSFLNITLVSVCQQNAN